MTKDIKDPFIFPESDPDINESLNTLRKGGVILYPTDTIWGLGCDALNEDAIQHIYKIKNRKALNPLVLLVSDRDMLQEYIPYVHPRILTLLELHERPLTLIYPNPKGLPPGLVSKDNTVAIRIPLHPFCQSLISAFGRPITSTSANKSGLSFPSNFSQIQSDVISEVDYIVKFGQNSLQDATPSVIASFDKGGHLHFIRK
jgi:L-threonylcarbamoyladenylate synthase